MPGSASALRLSPSQVTGGGTWPADPLLGAKNYGLRFGPPNVAREFYPAYFAISDLSEVAPLDAQTRIAVRVEPISPGLRIWGFITVVHNQTQHATVISPR